MVERDNVVVLASGKARVRRTRAFGKQPGERTVVRSLGVLLIALGVLGYVPGLRLDGNLFGLLTSDGAHNVLHLFTGLAGVLAGFASNRLFARWYCAACTFIYSGVVLATLAGMSPAATRVILGPDTVLHLGVAALTLAAYCVAVSHAQADGETRREPAEA
ncbi:MAG TPA: DUF4383 domain-containing protein [Ktedonobacterales bacterium]|nr:DUF4383 domain-containing protein [Ktedonobacterales bacterium]